ncbi:hypothetical protein BDA96_10G312900 [Sorghum bicolor]|uniref:Uncharacterized protein n=1 Tax=Sorghum bicolor TaxID=4558 RepID=A0A921Q5W2_SORBI|nr:hypothetical protein BDA96_10G312900 [Sorghum bicolor]
MMGCCSRNRIVCPVLLLLLVVVVLLLLSPCSAELNAAEVRVRPARRLLVSRPSTSRQKADQQQKMRVGGGSTPFKQAAASFGRRIPRSGRNPIQNR